MRNIDFEKFQEIATAHVHHIDALIEELRTSLKEASNTDDKKPNQFCQLNSTLTDFLATNTWQDIRYILAFTHGVNAESELSQDVRQHCMQRTYKEKILGLIKAFDGMESDELEQKAGPLFLKYCTLFTSS